MNNKGFTMVEIIAVIAILGLLAVITTPAYNSISSNVKNRNFESKKNTIESQTLSYVEKYLKDKVYDGKTTDASGNLISEKLCFTVGYLIENGIISSDSETEEYILNDIDNVKYSNDSAYVFVKYDSDKFKLESKFIGSKVSAADSEFRCSDDKIYKGV